MSKENGTTLVEAVVKATGERVVIQEHVLELNQDAYGPAAPPVLDPAALEQATQRLAEAAGLPLDRAGEIVREAVGIVHPGHPDHPDHGGPPLLPAQASDVATDARTHPQPPQPPKRSAKHAEWVEYATTRGVDYLAAKDMSRDALADLYLNPDSPNYTPAADESDEPDETDPADDADQPASTDQEVTP
jgi:hypothetical protein